MNRTITYAIHKDEGTVISRVGSELAWPVLEFEKIGAGGNFTGPLEYHLEKIAVMDSSVRREWGRLRWTKKIPVRLKNIHRKFWGFKPLTSDDN